MVLQIESAPLPEVIDPAPLSCDHRGAIVGLDAYYCAACQSSFMAETSLYKQLLTQEQISEQSTNGIQLGLRFAEPG